jgi:hypothetical protein
VAEAALLPDAVEEVLPSVEVIPPGVVEAVLLSAEVVLLGVVLAAPDMAHLCRRPDRNPVGEVRCNGMGRREWPINYFHKSTAVVETEI